MSHRGRHKFKRNTDGWEQWGGYMNARIQKLEGQFKDGQQDNSSHSSNIFKGISIFVNGYTDPTAAELKRIMAEHGGSYYHYYSRSKVTHIIAVNLPDSKVVNITDKKVVHPKWITESVQAKRLLPYQNYLLFTAKTGNQPTLFGKGVTAIKSTYNTSTAPGNTGGFEEDVAWEDDNLFQNLVTDTSHFSDDKNEGCQNIHDVGENGNLLSPMEFVKENQKDGTVTSKSNESLNFSLPEDIVDENESNHTSALKSSDSNFVAEFYNHSRLHYISTWGAELKAYVRNLQSKDSSFSGRYRLKQLMHSKELQGQNVLHVEKPKKSGKLQHVVMHIDMDCFFVSVALRDRPDLIGKPVVITHSKGLSAPTNPNSNLEYEKSLWRKHKGIDEGTDKDANEAADLNTHPSAHEIFHSMAEIASCSYEARKFGVRNGMFMGAAKKLCPDIVPLPYQFDDYRRISQQLYDIIASYTHDIEAVSCDEMYVDCSDLLADVGMLPLEFTSVLRSEVTQATGCPVSAGLGSNMLLARMATKKAKPNGQFLLTDEEAAAFLSEREVSDLPGVGWSTSKKLKSLNVITCGELSKISLSILQENFGPKLGQTLYNMCRGIDSRTICSQKERKSVSAEINYGIRFQQEQDMEKFMNELSEEVERRLQKLDVKGKTITLKLMVRSQDAPLETMKFMGHGICDYKTKSVSLPMATDNAKLIAKQCITIAKSFSIAPEDYRGIGIQMTRLEAAVKQHAVTSILQFTTKTSAPPSSNMMTKKELTAPDLKTSLKLSEKPDISSLHGKQPELKSVLPPLPALPDTLDKSVSLSLNANLVNNKQLHDDFILPSLSQIDMSVLKQLPADIQKEISDQLNKQHVDSNKLSSSSGVSNNPNSSSGVNNNQQGCSHWFTANSNQTAKVTAQCDDEKPLDFNDEQELDKSFLAAMPDDIRKELEIEFAKQQQYLQQHQQQHQYQQQHRQQQQQQDQQQQQQQQLPFQTEQISSPSKQSPKKRNIVQAVLSPTKVKITSPEKMIHSINSPVKNKQHQKRVKTGSRRGRKKRNLLPERGISLHKQSNLAHSSEIQMQSNHVEELCTSAARVEQLANSLKVNLCGAVTYTEVKVLLCEWIESSQDPLEEDVDRFLTYISELVIEKDLEMVQMLLLYLHKKTSHLNSNSWSQCIAMVTQQAQALVQSAYGAPLKLSY